MAAAINFYCLFKNYRLQLEILPFHMCYVTPVFFGTFYLSKLHLLISLFGGVCLTMVFVGLCGVVLAICFLVVCDEAFPSSPLMAT